MTFFKDHGNCHCGGYRFELQMRAPVNIIKCRCQLCKKQGYLWKSLDDAIITITRDDGYMVQYDSAELKHLFCSKCGSSILGEHIEGPLRGLTLVNLRMLLGCNPFREDRRTRAPYLFPSPLYSAPSISGSCHCGKVKVEIMTPLSGLMLDEGNCSICVRNAWAVAYPSSSEVNLIGTENVTEYRFGTRFIGHPFCTTCGVHVYVNMHGPSQFVMEILPDDTKEMIRNLMEVKPINIRVLDGVELEGVKIERSDEGTDGYERDVLGLT